MEKYWDVSHFPILVTLNEYYGTGEKGIVTTAAEK